MEIRFSVDFRKRYQKLNDKIKKAFHQRLKLFTQDTRNSLLRDHALSGKLKGYRSFSVTGDIRAVYYIQKNIAYFVDVGTHNQVYGK